MWLSEIFEWGILTITNELSYNNIDVEEDFFFFLEKLHGAPWGGGGGGGYYKVHQTIWSPVIWQYWLNFSLWQFIICT